MISRVEWDSEQFGLNIGRIELSQGMVLDMQAFQAEASAFNVVYVFTDTKLDLDKSFFLADSKVVFTKNLKSLHAIEGISEFDSNLDNYNQLLELAYISGVYSRFKTDPGFVKQEFEHLYKTWLDKSLSGEIADFVLLFRVEKDIAGFVTLKLQTTEKAIIGLIAVNPRYRGKGIAGNLLKACETFSFKAGIKTLEVATQLQNKPAMALYEKNQFSIKSITHIYHYRNP